MEQILSQNAFNFEITAQSNPVEKVLMTTLIDIEGSEIIISENVKNKFTIRNRKDLSILQTVEHGLGFLRCGITYPDKKIVVLGIGNNLMEFNYEKREFIKNSQTIEEVFKLVKVNDNSFLTVEWFGYIELINKIDLTCLSHLQIEGISGIYSIEKIR